MRRLSSLLAVGCVLVLTACAAGPRSDSAPDPGGERATASDTGWSRVPQSPLSARQGTVAAAITERFLVIGGTTATSCPPNASCAASPLGFLRDGAVFDPATGVWASIADAPVPVSSYRTAVLGDSLYMIDVPDPTKGNEVFLRYDLGDDEWTTLPDPPSPSSALIAAGDRVVAIADTDERGPTRDGAFDPAKQKWTPLPADPLGPSFNRGAAWVGDRLLLTGQRLVGNPGADGPSLTRMALLSPDLTTWTLLPDSPIIGGNPVAVGDQVVFPGGGSADGGEVGNWGRSYDYGGVWDSTTRRWRALPGGGPDNLQEAQPLPVLSPPSHSRVLLGSAFLDPTDDTWSRVPESPLSKRSGAGTGISDHYVLVWGGTAEKFTHNLADGALLRY